jgi:hypothetical protein
MTCAVLKEYGDPEKVAASYQGERYLIGPRLYPTFEKVVLAVLPITIVLALVGLGIALEAMKITADDILSLVFSTLGSMFSSAITTVGAIALIFVLLERTVPDFRVKVKEPKEWDPRSLARLRPSDRVRLGEMIVEIVFSFAAIVLFNFYPQWLGYTPSLNSVVETGSWQSVTFLPLLSEAFFRYVPFLTAVWGLTMVLDIVLLRQGTWILWTRLSSLGLKLASIGIAAVMLAGPSLVAATPELLAARLGDAEAADILSMGTQAVRLALVLVIVFGGLDIIKSLVRLLRGNIPLVVGNK